MTRPDIAIGKVYRTEAHDFVTIVRRATTEEVGAGASVHFVTSRGYLVDENGLSALDDNDNGRYDLIEEVSTQEKESIVGKQFSIEVGKTYLNNEGTKVKILRELHEGEEGYGEPDKFVTNQGYRVTETGARITGADLGSGDRFDLTSEFKEEEPEVEPKVRTFCGLRLETREGGFTLTITPKGAAFIAGVTLVTGVAIAVVRNR